MEVKSIKLGEHVKYGDIRHWLEFYPNFTRARFIYSSWWYFDERPIISTNISTLIAIILPFIVGLSWWLLLLFPILYFAWGEIFIHIPYDSGKDDSDYPQYGFYNYGHTTIRNVDNLVFTFGEKSIYIDYPHSLKHYATWYKMNDGEWLKYKHKYWNEKLENERYSFTYDFKYVLQNGQVQSTVATVKEEKKEWRRCWLPFTSLFALTKHTIDVKFNDQIGEEAGSWKGGVLGCGWDIKKGQTALDSIKDMEKNRKFK